MPRARASDAGVRARNERRRRTGRIDQSEPDTSQEDARLVAEAIRVRDVGRLNAEVFGAAIPDLQERLITSGMRRSPVVERKLVELIMRLMIIELRHPAHGAGKSCIYSPRGRTVDEPDQLKMLSLWLSGTRQGRVQAAVSLTRRTGGVERPSLTRQGFREQMWQPLRAAVRRAYRSGRTDATERLLAQPSLLFGVKKASRSKERSPVQNVR